MLPLRFPGLWLSLGWFLVLLLCALTLAPTGGAPMPPGIDKLLHFAAYLTMMVWFSGIYGRQRYVVLAIGLLVLGIALEFGQRAIGYRNFEINDMLANAAGIALGWVAAVTVIGGWCQRLEALLPTRG